MLPFLRRNRSSSRWSSSITRDKMPILRYPKTSLNVESRVGHWRLIQSMSMLRTAVAAASPFCSLPRLSARMSFSRQSARTAGADTMWYTTCPESRRYGVAEERNRGHHLGPCHCFEGETFRGVVLLVIADESRCLSIFITSFLIIRHVRFEYLSNVSRDLMWLLAVRVGNGLVMSGRTRGRLPQILGMLAQLSRQGMGSAAHRCPRSQPS